MLTIVERLEQLKPNLDVGNISKMKELQPKVAELSKIQIDQREEADKVSVETLELVQKYNNIIATLSEAFLHADQVVTKAESEITAK